MELSFLIVVAQLTESYIRWLAFSSKIGDEIKSRLFRNYFLWGATSFFVYSLIFATLGINAVTHKVTLMLGWIPYFIIGTRIIKWGLAQHTFVFGMNIICAVVQHTISGIIISEFFFVRDEVRLITMETTSYLFLFAIFLPIYGRYFSKLLPSREFFDMRPIGIYVAIFPLVIVSGHLIRLADDVLIPSDAERMSRIYLPLVFFFFYRYILHATKNFYDLQRMNRNKTRLSEQLSDLKKYNEQVQENQKKISVIRHDLRHSYNLIYAMLESGNVEKALEHIKKQEESLRGDKK